MRKMISTVAVLALLSVGASAQTTKTNLKGVDQALAEAQKEARIPKVSIYKLSQIVSSPEYIAYLQELTYEIMGDNTNIPLETIKKNGIVGVSWDALSDKEQSQLKGFLSRKDGSVREVDVITMIALLDAQLEKDPNTNDEVFHMDAHFSAGENSGLAQAYQKEIFGLQADLSKFTRRYENAMAKKEQIIQSMYQEMKEIQWYQNGRVNQTELDRLFDLIGSKCSEIRGLAWDVAISVPRFSEIFEEAIKDHLVNKEQDRGGGTSYIFDDGTKLYHNSLYGEHHYTQITQ